MILINASRSNGSHDAIRSGHLFLLEMSGGHIHSTNPDGTNREVIGMDCRLTTGIVVEADAGYIYRKNMGSVAAHESSIERVDPDGKNRMIIIPQGITHTSKQIHRVRDSDQQN